MEIVLVLGWLVILALMLFLLLFMWVALFDVKAGVEPLKPWHLGGCFVLLLFCWATWEACPFVVSAAFRVPASVRALGD